MTAADAQRLSCPECRAELTPDQTKLNITIDACPQGHGIFLDEGDIQAIMGDTARGRLHKLVGRAPSVQADCPQCGQALRGTQLGDVLVRGCSHCGSLWFNNDELRAHVLEVRKRAYGQNSMAARLEVVREAASFFPAEIVAGLLTDFDLDQGP